MKIHEYQAKTLFGSYGIAVPEGQLAHTPEEAMTISQRYKGAVAIKAQVHTGGRGKAGGIQLARSPEEARKAAASIIGMTIKGSTVRKVWVEKASAIKKEAYLSVILDRSSKNLTFIGSAEGGVEIEVIAEETPEKIYTFQAFPDDFPESEARKMAERLFDDKTTADAVLDIMRKLHTLFIETDSSLAEINPLVLTEDGEVIALDGKVNFDDNALYRHPEIEKLRDPAEENDNETEAREKGLSFVALDGSIGCMVNGAGLAMATMDMIQFSGGSPANFLDVGGSSSPEKVLNAFKLLLDNKRVKAILVNIFGGITRSDDIARGIVQAYEQMEIKVPVVVRLVGTNSRLGLDILKDTPLIPAVTLAEGVQKAIDLAKG